MEASQRAVFGPKGSRRSHAVVRLRAAATGLVPDPANHEGSTARPTSRNASLGRPAPSLRLSFRVFGHGQSHALLHFLARLELDDGASGNRGIGTRHSGIASDLRLGPLHLERSKVSKDHLITVIQVIGDGIDELLHHFMDLLLSEPGSGADGDHKITFRNGSHRMDGVEFLSALIGVAAQEVIISYG
jgi:hypothetical protein